MAFTEVKVIWIGVKMYTLEIHIIRSIVNKTGS